MAYYESDNLEYYTDNILYKKLVSKKWLKKVKVFAIISIVMGLVMFLDLFLPYKIHSGQVKDKFINEDNDYIIDIREYQVEVRKYAFRRLNINDKVKLKITPIFKEGGEIISLKDGIKFTLLDIRYMKLIGVLLLLPLILFFNPRSRLGIFISFNVAIASYIIVPVSVLLCVALILETFFN